MQQAVTLTEEGIAGFEKAVTEIEIQLATIDDSTPEGAQHREVLEAMIARFRAIASAARSGEAIDPATVTRLPGELDALCP
jgi:hypothetical protein